MDERLPDLPPAMSDQQRWAMHGMLLAACAGIYAIFRAMWTTTEGTDHASQVHGSIPGSFAVLFMLAAIAFGTASWFQPRWCSKDAGRVATAVWFLVTCGYALLVPCPRVMLLIAIPFVPFCLGALIGHNIGRFHHPAHWDGIEMNFED